MDHFVFKKATILQVQFKYVHIPNKVINDVIILNESNAELVLDYDKNSLPLRKTSVKINDQTYSVFFIKPF